MGSNVIGLGGPCILEPELNATSLESTKTPSHLGTSYKEGSANFRLSGLPRLTRRAFSRLAHPRIAGGSEIFCCANQCRSSSGNKAQPALSDGSGGGPSGLQITFENNSSWLRVAIFKSSLSNWPMSMTLGTARPGVISGADSLRPPRNASQLANSSSVWPLAVGQSWIAVL